VFFELTDCFEVAANIDHTWKFFGSADNLPLITPPWLKFKLQENNPRAIEQDSILNYTISWMGLPVKWQTRIVEWSPPNQFIDLQVRGPYALWHHQHTFTPTEQGTACRDRVIYQLPIPVIGPLVHEMIVRKQLLEIFRFRRRVIGERLGWIRAIQPDVAIRRL
jgi:ligand-binding SRPBCC domain-containing protein